MLLGSGDPGRQPVSPRLLSLQPDPEILQVVAASDAAGVDLSREDVPVSGFPAVFGQGAPGKSGKCWSPSLVTFLRSLRAGMLLVVGEGCMTSGPGVAQSLSLESSGSPAWDQQSQPHAQRDA